MKAKKKQYWFKAKTYGWGWTPSTWQGWMVMLAYVAAVAASSIFVLHPSSIKAGWIEYATAVLAATVLVIVVCYKTGEKPRWRWG